MNEALKRHQKGLLSEEMAAIYLIFKGYRVLARRYKTPHGEIDLIAAKGKTVAFVEVKARDTQATGLEAITLRSQGRIQNAAQYYVQRHKGVQNCEWRFDAVVVRTWRLPYHLKDAWRP